MSDTTSISIPKGFVYRFEHWGKPFWNVMHSITFTYPDNPTDDDKERVRAFFRIIPHFLPCSICGLHFFKEMGDHPLTDEVLVSMDSLSRWLVELHNNVNVRLKKPVLTYDVIKKFFFEDATTDPRSSPAPTDSAINPMYKTAFWSISIILGLVLLLVAVLVVLPHFQSQK